MTSRCILADLAWGAFFEQDLLQKRVSPVNHRYEFNEDRRFFTKVLPAHVPSGEICIECGRPIDVGNEVTSRVLRSTLRIIGFGSSEIRT